MLTIPRSLFKSSAKDLSLPIFVIVFRLRRFFGEAFVRHYTMLSPGAYRYSRHIGRGEYRRISSMDSDLEAFSHNPTDGSFGALAFQPTPFTNYLNQRFLSY